ncbi:MAG: carboxypeptidase regulatory-like domain-containing protein [Bacteroidia bacterium]|nr:carboxypeptidase regulatory-like domain-containing protein [Bacteroidia bacterium]
MLLTKIFIPLLTAFLLQHHPNGQIVQGTVLHSIVPCHDSGVEKRSLLVHPQVSDHLWIMADCLDTLSGNWVTVDSVLTNAKGQFALGLPPGEYIFYPKFLPQPATDVQIVDGFFRSRHAGGIRVTHGDKAPSMITLLTSEQEPCEHLRRPEGPDPY